MIINLTENQSYDLKFLESYQASTAGNKITFHQELSQADIDAINTHINLMTQVQREASVIEAKRVEMIINKADAHILNSYSEKKQRKLLSIAVALQDKVINGGTLTTGESAALQSVRDVNGWVTAVRVIENTSIADTTITADMVTF